jgi:hypothetical protein
MMTCPRQRDEAVLPSQREHRAHWRDDSTCSYCGSLSEGALFEAIERGDEIHPTDKNYKIYIVIPNPDAGKMRVVSAANYQCEGDGWVQVTEEVLPSLPAEARDDLGKWVQIAPTEATKHAKFYFQHLTEFGRGYFLRLYNEGKLKLAYPGYFYVLPFFVARGDEVLSN